MASTTAAGFPSTPKKISRSPPYTSGAALRERGEAYKSNSAAGTEEQRYIKAVHGDALPECMKPRANESIREYMHRALRHTPNVVRWVRGQKALEKHVPQIVEQWLVNIFTTEITTYLIDWYFMEVGRCLAEEDTS